MPTGPSTTSNTPTAPLRDRILREALAILDSQGIGALTVRAVAARSDCSTIGVYTHFGGKQGLVEAILLEGFADFAAAVGVVDSEPDGGPGTGRERLRRSAHMYREWALANRPRYLLMFSPGPAAPVVRDEVYAEGRRSRTAHDNRVRRAMEQGDLRPGDVEAMATGLWVHLHGWVMAELTAAFDVGPEDVARAAYDDYLNAMFDGVAAPASRPARSEPRSPAQ